MALLGKHLTLLAAAGRRSFASSSQAERALASLHNQSFLSTAQLSCVLEALAFCSVEWMNQSH